MPVVICDNSHIVIYMNPAAVEHYSSEGGKSILGLCIFDCHNPQSNDKIRKVFDWFAKDKKNNIIHTFYNPRTNKDVYMVALRDENGDLIGYYEKHVIRTKDESSFYNL